MISKRGKGNYKGNFGMNDLYKHYVYSFDGKVSKSNYSKVLKEINDLLTDAIVYDSLDLRFPFRLGRLYIHKSKIKNYVDENGKINEKRLKPDWKKTRELWDKHPEARSQGKRIYHLNEHTDGYKYKWHWEKLTCNIRNNTAYSLIIAREAKRKLPKALKNKDLKVDYYEWG